MKVAPTRKRLRPDTAISFWVGHLGMYHAGAILQCSRQPD